MAIIVLTTAAGAPGASTTSLGLALTWSGPTVLIEADPSGSSIVPGWYRCAIDPAPRNLVNLALTDHATDLAEALLDQCVTVETNPPSDFDRLLLIGLSEPAQAPALQAWWDPIAHALQTLSEAGYTVIVDAGRLTQGSYPMPLLFAADQVLLVCRGTLSSIVRSAAMATQLRQTLDRMGVVDRLGLTVIHNSGRLYYSSAEAGKELQIGLTLTIPDDPAAAAVLSDGAPPRRRRLTFRRPRPTTADDGPDGTGDEEGSSGPVTVPAASPLLRAYRSAARDLQRHIDHRGDRLGPTPTPATSRESA